VKNKPQSFPLQKFYQPYLFFPYEKKVRDFALYYLKGSQILDAGCGNGWLSICAENEGYNVYSVDLANNEIKESRFIFKRKKSRAALTKASLCGLPFTNSAFDTIICINVLEHVLDIEKAFLNLKTVLRKGGRLIVMIPNGLTFGLFYDRFAYRLIPANAIVSRVHKTLFSMTADELSVLKLNEEEPIGHCQEFTISRIRSLLREHGFKIIKIVNCRFLSPYMRSLCTLLGKKPMLEFEKFDSKLAEKVPSNLASEWMIVCEKQ